MKSTVTKKRKLKRKYEISSIPSQETMSQGSSYFSQTSLLRRLRNGSQPSISSITTNTNTTNITGSNSNEPIIIHVECANWQLGPTELTLMAEAISSGNTSQESVYPVMSMDLSYNRICNLDLFNTDNPDHSGLNNLVTAFITISKLTRLRKFSLSYNIILDEGFRIVSEMISPNGPIYLQELYLKGCGGKSKGLKALSRYLEVNRILVILDLDQNDFSTKSLQSLSEGLKQNRRLKNLYLRSCCIESDGVGYLMTMLQTNYTLSILNLSNNKLGDDGAEIIGNGIKTITSLTHLDVQDNQITTIGSNHIFNGLSKNVSLQFIGLKWNNINDDFKTNVCNCLESNVSLKTIYVIGNHIRVETSDDIIKFSSKIKTREKPIDIDISWTLS